MGSLETFKMFVNGKWVDSENGSTFESINPSIGKSWALIPEATANDVNNAVEALIKPSMKVNGQKLLQHKGVSI